MKINKKALCALLTAALLTASVIGCAKDQSGDPAKTDAEGNVITTAGTVPADGTGTAEITDSTGGAQSPTSNAEGTVTTRSPEEIKAEYAPTSEMAELLKNENTVSEITYTGFHGHAFSTPKISDPGGYMIMPVFSHAGLEKYIADNEKYYDFGSGKGSFTAAVDAYSDSYFTDGKCLLIVAFNDAEGGGSHHVVGGWENHLHVDDLHLDQFTIAVKKAAGDITSGHLLVEIDTDFVGLWDTFDICIYE